ncbi:helix-turn-helix transcriptional regulator [Labrenzia sp. PHM005]|nr:helix-turn-helix transcriptional regulator [Labrenzia sp. PHM005]
MKVTSIDLERHNQDVDTWVTNDFSGPCSVRDILDRVGDKWSVLVILRLGRKTERFRQLMRSIDGISQRMLTVTLRGLERDGLVNRKVLATSPPAVEYSLTPLGLLLLDQVTGLVNWALEHEAAVTACRQSYDARQT